MFALSKFNGGLLQDRERRIEDEKWVTVKCTGSGQFALRCRSSSIVTIHPFHA